MELIQFGGFVGWVQSGNQRIAGETFNRSIRDTKQERAAEQAPVIPSKNRQQDTRQVTHESQADNATHADGITQRASKQHGQSESPEGGAIDPADLLVGQSNSSVHELMAAPRMARLMAVTIKARQLALNKREALGEDDMGRSPQRTSRKNLMFTVFFFGTNEQN